MKEISEELEQIKTAVREGHELLKELKVVVKEGREMYENLLADSINIQVKTGLESYAKTIDLAIESATDAVYKRFETLGNIMTGKGTKEDLEELAVKWSEQRDKIAGR